MNTETTNIYKVDATGQALGRLASDIAMHLRDKHLPTFTPNKPGTTVVEVENIDGMTISGKKVDSKVIYHHTGYPGGIKETAWKDLVKTDPGALLRHTVRGMLPANRLRKDALKRLIIKTNA